MLAALISSVAVCDSPESPNVIVIWPEPMLATLPPSTTGCSGAGGAGEVGGVGAPASYSFETGIGVPDRTSPLAISDETDRTAYTRSPTLSAEALDAVAVADEWPT